MAGDETITCANCGAVVDGPDERCPECDVPIRVVCPNCGERAPADEDDCPVCGESLAHAS